MKRTRMKRMIALGAAPAAKASAVVVLGITLAGCIVVPAHRHWVPGHHDWHGYWVPGHYA